MRFLYVAPRYHTNQIPIMHGLKERGHEIVFLSQYAGRLEDYSDVTPIIIGYSKIYLFFDKIYMYLMRKRNVLAGDKKIKFGVPKIGKLARCIKESNADVAVLRERSVYSIFAYWCCKYNNIPAILYNQSPLWENHIKNDLAHQLMRWLTPRVRMTPVLGVAGPKKVKEQGAVFVPFVMEPAVKQDEITEVEKNVSGKNKTTIEIFCIGKYEKRKNQRMLLEVIRELSDNKAVHLTIAGECTSAAHEEYYKGLVNFIRESRLDEKVTLLKNLSREQVNKQYDKSDLFIIPSTAEPASISQLEAMAYGLPIICSDKNGTACYVEHGINGYLFKDNQKDSLKEITEQMLADVEKMNVMGRKSLCLVKEKYQIDAYLKGIEELLRLLKET